MNARNDEHELEEDGFWTCDMPCEHCHGSGFIEVFATEVESGLMLDTEWRECHYCQRSSSEHH